MASPQIAMSLVTCNIFSPWWQPILTTTPSPRIADDFVVFDGEAVMDMRALEHVDSRQHFAQWFDRPVSATTSTTTAAVSYTHLTLPTKA